MKHLKLTAVLLLFAINLSFAQNYDFGKVSKDELQEQINPLDSTADATILYRKERVYFTLSTSSWDFMQHREVQMRVKIYNKEGFDWANEKVYLYDGERGNNENLRSLRGYTYNLEGGKIQKEKMSNDATFTEQVSENLKAKSFTLPNIKEGSVIEYKYEITSEFLTIDDVFLQYEIPVKRLEVSVETPQYIKYKKLTNPRAYYIPKLIESKKTATLSTRSQNGGEYENHITKINEDNILALKAESYSGNIGNYRAKLSVELQAFLNEFGIETKSFSSDWEMVSKTIYESNAFGGQLRKSSFFKEDLEPALSGVEDDFQKAVIVENLVKSKVKWNGSYGKFSQKGIREAYKEGEGNVADINLLVVAMLKSAGVNADPILVSTPDNGIPLFPTRDGFNYVIAMVRSNDGYMLIDASETYSGNNVLPTRALNWRGRAVYDDGTSDWVEIKPNKKSQESSMMNVKFTEDLTAEGTIRKNYTDYLALNYRNRYANVDADDQIKQLESNKGDIEISDLEMENLHDPFKSLRVSYAFELSDGIDAVGDQLYFNPLLFFASKENPFKLEERKYPIDYTIPLEEKYKINILLPEGYKVESLPKSEAVAFRDNDVKFMYRIKQNGQYLQLSIDFQINFPVIRPTDYQEFKQFYSKIIEKQQEQVVLSKSDL